MAAVASHGLCQAQTAAAAVPEPQNRYFTRFSRSPPASSGCAQLIRHKSACGRSGDQGSQGEPPRSLGGLYAAVGAPAQSYRGSTIIPWPLPPPLALSTIFRRFSADVAVLPAASPFRGAAAAAFPLILRRAASNCDFECECLDEWYQSHKSGRRFLEYASVCDRSGVYDRRGRQCVCAGGRPLQATSHPEWVGHVTMMISSTLVRVSSCRNFALRASILVVTSVAHAGIL